MERRSATYDLKAEPVGVAYRALLAYAAGVCGSAILVLRPTISLDDRGAGVLTALLPFVTRREETRSWPGTELSSDEQASVIHFELNRQTLEILSRVGGLFAWVEPSLPEDLCLFRENGSVWLTTIAHERDAYLDLRADEFDGLRTAVPDLRLERRDDRRLAG